MSARKSPSEHAFGRLHHDDFPNYSQAVFWLALSTALAFHLILGAWLWLERTPVEEASSVAFQLAKSGTVLAPTVPVQQRPNAPVDAADTSHRSETPTTPDFTDNAAMITPLAPVKPLQQSQARAAHSPPEQSSPRTKPAIHHQTQPAASEAGTQVSRFDDTGDYVSLDHPAINDYKQRLIALIQRNFPDAGQFNQTYRIGVIMALHESGILEGLQVVHSSGHAPFDALTQQTLLRLSPYPAPPAEAADNGYQFDLDFLFTPDAALAPKK